VEHFFSENRLYFKGAWLRLDLEDSSDSEGRASVGRSSHLRNPQIPPLLARASGFLGFRGPCQYGGKLTLRKFPLLLQENADPRAPQTQTITNQFLEEAPSSCATHAGSLRPFGRLRAPELTGSSIARDIY